MRPATPTVPRRDLPNATLLLLTAAAAVAIASWFTLLPRLPASWRVPGSPALYVVGVCGTVLLLVPVAFTLAKRGGASRHPVGWFNAHVSCALLGSVLIAIHCAGYLGNPPALLLLALAGLAALGIWARVRGARQMAATFASKAPLFRVPDATALEQLRAIVAAKQQLLHELDPGAREATFSVTLGHLLRSPRRARAYQRLARAEARLLGSRRAVGFAQAWWRPLHLALAWIFVLGVITHVIVVTFFAGYAAGGAPITWWHLAAW